MKIEVATYGMKVIPETAQDEIYLDSYLGLKTIGDSCECTMVADSLNWLHGGRSVEIKPIEG
jgi:hypothetical protein